MVVSVKMGVESETGFCPSSPATTRSPPSSAGRRSITRVPVRIRRSWPMTWTVIPWARGRVRPRRSRSISSASRESVCCSAPLSPTDSASASGGSSRSRAAQAVAESLAAVSALSEVTTSPRWWIPAAAISPK